MSLIDRITQALILVSRRGDIAIAAIVLVAVVMMIIPLPTPLVDVLITANIAASLLILLIAFYISEPLQLSSMPSLILLATLFRLAITISTARLILLQADAGEIINAFGSFVVGGNVAVGLVVFVIITVAQFVVITKGAERVAEVAARFSLDALPGKQMSIDSDLRGGDIDKAEAQRQRRSLSRESHLYGSMDGAMKFVRGDAIAGLVIIVVNLIGGLTIGSIQHGMTLSAAAGTYSLLTVGDGLVAQIPALLVSVAAGTVVTRVGTTGRQDLGTEILGQLLGDQRALFLAAAILLALALIPGFPWYVFVASAAVFALAGYWSGRQHTEIPSTESTEKRAPKTDSDGGQRTQPQPAPAADEAPKAFTQHRITVCIGPSLGQRVPAERFERETVQLRQTLGAELGLDLPTVGLRIDESQEPHHFKIEFEGVPVVDANIPEDSLLVEGDAVDLELLAVPYAEGPRIGNRSPTKWVGQQYEAKLAGAGIAVLDATGALGIWLSQMLRQYATQFVGIQETRDILAKSEKDYPELHKEVQKILSLQKIAEILRRLLDESVPISNMRLILEALVEWVPRDQDTILLAEYVRIALRRQICFRCADRNRVIVAYMLERSAEETLRSSVRTGGAGSFLNMPDAAARPIVERIRDAFAGAPDTPPVVLASMDVRRHVRSLLVRNDLDVSVLSYQELAPEFSIQPLVGRIDVPHKAAAAVAVQAAE
jgi:type III secretion protein V